MMILKVVILSLLCNYCDADHCTDSCDQQFPGGLNVTMCGTDMETHLTHSDAFYDNTCYDLCGIMTYYEGVCGCPHNCYNEFNQGTCMMMDNAKCQCAAGWGGDDCSLPLTGNSCSLHGSIVSTTDKDSVYVIVGSPALIAVLRNSHLPIILGEISLMSKPTTMISMKMNILYGTYPSLQQSE